jgi:hypothetical protein
MSYSKANQYQMRVRFPAELCPESKPENHVENGDQRTSIYAYVPGVEELRKCRRVR